MPPVTLHCLLHLTPSHILQSRFSAIHAIQSASNARFGLLGMIGWSSLPYAVWQLSYHFFITVRRREKIAAGRPTSFTWLKRSYGSSWIGKLVLGLPLPLQEPGFMLVQYLYAVSSMLPAPIWFWYRWPSAVFLTCLFGWSIYNGATYYIDVFGTRFQKELEQMKKDVAKWQMSPVGMSTPFATSKSEENANPLDRHNVNVASRHSTDNIPLLDINTPVQSIGTALESDQIRRRLNS